MNPCTNLYIKCDLIYGTPVLLTLGFLYSIWTNYMYFSGFDMWHGDYFPVFLSHISVTLSTSYLFYMGIKHSEQKCIKPWIYWKCIEQVALILTIATVSTTYYVRYSIIIPGVIFLVAGIYFIQNARNAYANLRPNSPDSEKSDNVITDYKNQEIKVALK